MNSTSPVAASGFQDIFRFKSQKTDFHLRTFSPTAAVGSVVKRDTYRKHSKSVVIPMPLIAHRQLSKI